MSRDDIESFFRTLLLGDFDEHQNTSAQLVGGLISLVPVLDQVMDVRDITGALFNIGKRGGFKSASPDQLVNLGFAAFGAIPELGSAFKTVFKPMWKERRLAKGAVHGGLEAIESLLNLGKGGAIGWVRKELIGKWGARTSQAIAAVEAGLASCIELTEFIATASGWKDWLIPDSVQALAKELLPQLKSLQGTINAPLQRASNEIRAFLEDLLGEQAAAVVMSIGQQAVMASAVPATRTKSGHNAADLHPHGKEPSRQPERKVQRAQEANASKGAGPLHVAMQVTRKAISSMANQEKGLVGEHMVDYHELKRLGGNWPHDKKIAEWNPQTIRKLNCDKRPVNLSLEDLRKVNQPGLDAVWEHAGRYTVTEAKASASIGAAYGMGKFKEKRGDIPVVTGLSPDHQLLHYLLSDSSDKGGGADGRWMQMSVVWVKDRARGEKLEKVALKAVLGEVATRRVVLVSLESNGAPDHVQALADIHLLKPSEQVHLHVEHGSMKEWEAAAIDAVEDARKAAHKTKNEAARQQPGPASSRSKKKT